MFHLRTEIFFGINESVGKRKELSAKNAFQSNGGNSTCYRFEIFSQREYARRAHSTSRKKVKDRERKPGSVHVLPHVSSFIYAIYPPRLSEQLFSWNESNGPGLFDLTARKVFLARLVTKNDGGLLHPLFTLTTISNGGLISAALSVR